MGHRPGIGYVSSKHRGIGRAVERWADARTTSDGGIKYVWYCRPADARPTPDARPADVLGCLPQKRHLQQQKSAWIHPLSPPWWTLGCKSPGRAYWSPLRTFVANNPTHLSAGGRVGVGRPADVVRTRTTPGRCHDFWNWHNRCPADAPRRPMTTVRCKIGRPAGLVSSRLESKYVFSYFFPRH